MLLISLVEKGRLSFSMGENFQVKGCMFIDRLLGFSEIFICWFKNLLLDLHAERIYICAAQIILLCYKQAVRDTKNSKKSSVRYRI